MFELCCHDFPGAVAIRASYDAHCRMIVSDSQDLLLGDDKVAKNRIVDTLSLESSINMDRGKTEPSTQEIQPLSQTHSRQPDHRINDLNRFWTLGTPSYMQPEVPSSFAGSVISASAGTSASSHMADSKEPSVQLEQTGTFQLVNKTLVRDTSNLTVNNILRQPVRNLTGKVTRESNIARFEGSYSDIFVGKYANTTVSKLKIFSSKVSYELYLGCNQGTSRG
jgi:hypothetical protein